ncbi:MAG: isopeptide-forming domain-containing fimbrial protein [Eubacteriales bacterium]|nr:isopeptide-forming domain-containing fimbrial protein [Eubacteriales bacterium]
MKYKKLTALTLALLLSGTSLISASDDTGRELAAESLYNSVSFADTEVPITTNFSEEPSSENTDYTVSEAEYEDTWNSQGTTGIVDSSGLPDESDSFGSSQFSDQADFPAVSENQDSSDWSNSSAIQDPPECFDLSDSSDPSESAEASLENDADAVPADSEPFLLPDSLLLPEDNLSGEENTLEEDADTDLLTDGEDLLSDGEEIAFMVAAGENPANYLHDSISRENAHGAKLSTDTGSSSLQGLHLDKDKVYRYYVNGKYYIDGSFSANGNRYYAEKNGALVSGWLKTAYTSQEMDLNDVNDFHFRYRYYDPKTFQQMTGYQVIDGLPHYFDPSGGMLTTNAGITIDGKFYYCDQYGICSQVRLAYGNTLISESNQNNDSYLAKNQLPAVDPNTFEGQDGSYSFRPKWYTNYTTSETFGGSPFVNGENTVIPLTSAGLKGQIGAIYRRVGQYNGREVDLILRVKDWEEYSLNGDPELGFFLVSSRLIGVSIANLKNITVDMQFLDHETQKPMTVKGYATFSDIDIAQTLSILSDVDQVYVSNDCVLYKDPDRLAFTSPFEIQRVGNRINDSVTANWVQANYNSNHLLFRFGNSFEQYRFTYQNLPVSTGNYYVWKKDYSGNAQDYSVMNSSGSVVQNWQGLYFKRLGMVSLAPIIKQVSDFDEILVTENTLSERDESYVYTLSHTVPGENSQFYYNSYTVRDVIPEDLTVEEDSFQVFTDGNRNVTERFRFHVSGQELTISGKEAWLSKESFYDNTYHFEFHVKIKDTLDLRPYEGSIWRVRNTASVSITRRGRTEEQESNPVLTNLPVDPTPLLTGEIRIQKVIKDSDILWAHGNPTFLFDVKGTDERGTSHDYAASICFRQGQYGTEGDLAVLETVISNVPLGTYTVTEENVLDYKLKDLKALSSNVTITGNSAATLAGEVILTETIPAASLQFTNEKTCWEGYHHNHIRINKIPLILSDTTEYEEILQSGY